MITFVVKRVTYKVGMVTMLSYIAVSVVGIELLFLCLTVLALSQMFETLTTALP